VTKSFTTQSRDQVFMKESSQKEQNREEVKVPTDDFRKMHDPGSLT